MYMYIITNLQLNSYLDWPVNWSANDTACKVLRWHTLERNHVYCVKEWELAHEALGHQELVHFEGRDSALQLLPVEQFPLYD